MHTVPQRLPNRHHHVDVSTVLDHVTVFVVTLVLSAAATFLFGIVILSRL
jgi:hypothetical protein